MMRQFLKVIGWVVVVLMLSHAAAVLAIGGAADPYYRRFISPPQKSLILGTSKAAQGVVPDVLDSILVQKEGSFFNYAFTINTSPFGKIYYESIQAKLDSSTKNGIFIITVDPWSISSLQSERRSLGREYGFLDQVTDPNQNPNWEYLMNNYKKSWGRIFVDQLTNFREYLHEDGWLEIRYEANQNELNAKMKSKIGVYAKRVQGFEFAPDRLDYLKQTIQLLDAHGQVFLVRLPIHQGILGLENQLMPEFDELMFSLADQYGLTYLNFTNQWDDYNYKDGNHLTRFAAIEFSSVLGSEIQGLRD